MKGIVDLTNLTAKETFPKLKDGETYSTSLGEYIYNKETRTLVPKEKYQMSTGRFKKIWDRNDLELEATIEEAKEHCGQKGLDFFKILAGVDAYLEKRKRKDGVGLQKNPQQENHDED